MSGKLSFQQAAEHSNKVATRSYQMVDTATTGAMRDVVPDVIENQSVTEQQNSLEYGPMPPIQRLDMETEKKLLTIDDNEAPLKKLQVLSCSNQSYSRRKQRFFSSSHTAHPSYGAGKRPSSSLNIIQGNSVCIMICKREI